MISLENRVLKPLVSSGVFIFAIFTDFNVKAVRFYESTIHHGFGAKQAIKYPPKRFQCQKYIDIMTAINMLMKKVRSGYHEFTRKAF